MIGPPCQRNRRKVIRTGSGVRAGPARLIVAGRGCTNHGPPRVCSAGWPTAADKSRIRASQESVGETSSLEISGERLAFRSERRLRRRHLCRGEVRKGGG